jgi:hypothetical protein
MKNGFLTTLVYILRNNFTRKTMLANSTLYNTVDGLDCCNTLIPYETPVIELLEDWEVGQYLGGN